MCNRFAWAATVPKPLFFEAVLPYANTNEARTNWRDLLWADLQPLLTTGGPSNSSLAGAATYLNNHMWAATALGRHNSNGAKITFHGEMTPRVYDPMSTILFGVCRMRCPPVSLCCMLVDVTLCCRGSILRLRLLHGCFNTLRRRTTDYWDPSSCDRHACLVRHQPAAGFSSDAMAADTLMFCLPFCCL